MDIGTLLTLRQSWNTFRANHPRFPEFLAALKSRGAVEGAEVTITVSYPDGQSIKSGLRLKASDVELFNTLSQMK